MCSVMRNLPDSDCDSLVAELRTIALRKDAVKNEIKRLPRKTRLRPDKSFVIAVQWHLEDQIALCPEQLRLFQRFAEACG